MGNKEKLLAFFDAENKRDWENYRQFLHSDIIWTLHSKTAQVIHGTDAYVNAMIDAYSGSDNTFVCESLYMDKSENRIVTILVNNRKERSCDIFEFKDGLIYEEHEFILS